MEDVPPCFICTDDSGDDPCAICFEIRPPLTLPCACTATYCASCWSRAIASSVRRRGQAQCPSCRMVLCIDIDPDTGHLLFSKQDGEMNQDKWLPRLSSKVKLVQIKLLKTYGNAVKRQSTTANESANTPGKGAAAKSLDQPATSHTLRKPMCVCGGLLERVTYRKRFSLLREDFGVEWRHRVSYVISCNLCDAVLSQSGSLWTCEDGCRSVLHPTSYDICESCFSKHVGLASGWSQCRAKCTALRKSNDLFKWPW